MSRLFFWAKSLLTPYVTPCYTDKKGRIDVSQWEKLIERILSLEKDLRFDELCKALERVGYAKNQPKGGSSHYVFRKPGCMPVTLPKKAPMNKAYVELVAEAVRQYLEEE